MKASKLVRRLGLVGPFLMILVSCKQGPLVSKAAYIIGPNDIQPLGSDNQSQVDARLMQAAVLLSTSVNETKRKFCSGTIIPPAEGDTHYRVITNHHCFAPDADENNKVPDQLLPMACTATKVYFGFFRDDIPHREVSDCADGSLRTDFQGDLAVLTLKSNPSERFKPAKLWQQDEIPSGRKASILHFPTIDATDPDADKDLVLEPTSGIRLPVAQVTLNDCETQGVFPPEEWSLDKSLKMGTKHSCDLKKGSSGSALWDNETGTILGVNWGGITLKYTEPDRTQIYNVATQAKYVRSFLANQQQSELERLNQIEAGNHNSANAELANGQAETARKKKNVLGCGSIMGPGAAEHGSSGPVICLLLLFPLLGLWRLRRGQS